MKLIRCKWMGIFFVTIIFIIMYLVMMNNHTTSDDMQPQKQIINKEWYSSFLGLDLNQYTGDKIKIGVIDTNISSSMQHKIEKSVSYASRERTDKYAYHADKMISVLLKVVPSSQIYHYGISTDNNNINPNLMVKAFKQALDDQVSIINISLNFKNEISSLDPLLRMAYEKGVIVVTSAGNEGINKISYPANAPYTIAVNSIEKNGHLAQYSNYGKGIDFSIPGSIIFNRKKEEGTSVSAIILTAMIARIIEGEENISSKEIVNRLRIYAGNKEKNYIVGYGTPKLIE